MKLSGLDTSIPSVIFGLRFVRLCKAILNVSFCSHQQFFCPGDCHWQQRRPVFAQTPSPDQSEASIICIDQSDASTDRRTNKRTVSLAIIFSVLAPIKLGVSQLSQSLSLFSAS